MLQGNGFKESETKEIFMTNRKAIDVIEFFELFYTRKRTAFLHSKTSSLYFVYIIYLIHNTQIRKRNKLVKT